MSIRVLLADDQAMVRAGFRLILESEPDIEVVGETENGSETISAVFKLKPDVVLMDIQMPEVDGLEATRQIIQKQAEQGSRILILTTFERDEYIFKALRSGASGFLLKNASPEDLISAVRTVAEGNALLAPSVTKVIIEEFAKMPLLESSNAEFDKLTGREIEVLKLIAKGMTNSEIATKLFVGEATVKTHVSSLLTKLGLRDRVQAVVFAYEHGAARPGTN